MDNSQQIMKAMQNAEASLNMEGLYVTEESKQLCYRLLNHEITLEEYLDAIKAKGIKS